MNEALENAFDLRKKIVAHQLVLRLMLIFCKEIDSKATTDNQLHQVCITKRINLYRVCVEQRIINVKPFLDDWNMFETPDCHAIVIPCPLH